MGPDQSFRCPPMVFLIFLRLNKLRWHAFFKFQPVRFWSRLLIQIHILIGKQCRSRSVGFIRSQLIWIYIICKDRTNLYSAGQGIIKFSFVARLNYAHPGKQCWKISLLSLTKWNTLKGENCIPWRAAHVMEEDYMNQRTTKPTIRPVRPD